MNLYNEELKNRYTEEKNEESVLPNNYLNCQFKKCAPVERSLGKDICDFTAYEIMDYYKLLNVTSLDSLIVMNSQLSMYTQWCIQENLVKDNQNHFLEVDNNMLNNCINKALFEKRIVTRAEVLDWVDQLPNPRDQFIMLAVFEGIKGKDFCEVARLRPEDIDSKGERALLCTGRKINISNELAEIINECIAEDTYYSISGSGAKTMTLVDKGYIVKDYPNVKDDVSDFQFGRKVYNSLKRSLSYVGVGGIMTANSLTDAGKMEMIRERSAYYKMTCEQYIFSDKLCEIENQYGGSIVRSTFWKKYGNYLR